MADAREMLTLSAKLPKREFAPGEVVLREGDPAGPIWVLESGALRVLKGGVPVNTVTQPGAVVGEVSVLLGGACSASVVATERTVLRHAPDGAALLASDPALMRVVACGLAERLDVITRYLVDLQRQYGDAPGIAMVGEVLGQLMQPSGPRARPGSAREPDPEY